MPAALTILLIGPSARAVSSFAVAPQRAALAASPQGPTGYRSQQRRL